MDVYIYTEKSRKVRGQDEEEVLLAPLAELEDFESIEDALTALLDAEPDLIGTEFVIFTEEPIRVTAGEPTAKYSFTFNGGDVVSDDGAEADEEEQDEGEDEEVEEAPKRTRTRNKAAAKRTPNKRAAKRTAPASKPAASKTTTRRTRSAKPAPRAGTRSGAAKGGKKSPFTRNPASDD